MKKSIIMLLLPLMIAAFTSVYADVVQIGSGTADLDLPINAYYGYTYSQSIFQQTEINVPNQRIESVYYYWNGVAEAVASNDWTIYMGHTAATEFASATRAQAAFGSRNGNRMFLDYDVYRFLAADEANPGSWTPVSSDIVNPLYTDNTFQYEPAGTYKWAVKANYSGALVSEPVISNSLGKVYDPQDIAATKSGSNVLLNWTAEPGATYYKVYAADDPYGTFTYLGYSQTNSYTITAPVAAKKFYKVTAIADEALPGRTK